MTDERSADTLLLCTRNEETSFLVYLRAVPCRIFCAPPSVVPVFCLIRRPFFRLEGPRFAFSLLEHLFHGCTSLARVSEKARDGPSKSHECHRVSSERQ